MNPSFFHEPARDLPCRGTYDVIVAGAGPAGMGAALAAARCGASVCLLEAHGSLGGVWTSGLLSWVIDAQGKPGIIREISDRLEARGARAEKGRGFAYDVEEMKLLLEELALEAGIHIHLHTRVSAALREGRRMRGVVIESKSGREALLAHVFIDTTGDGDLGAQAGCRYAYGDPREGRAQPMSLVAMLTGLHAPEIAPFIGGGVKEAKENLYREFRRAGVEPSYAAPTLFRVRDDLFTLMANHEYGVSPFDATAISEATLRARQEIHHLVHALQRLGPPWENLRIIASAEQIGVREGRRLRGRYEVSAEDIFSGKRHHDAVCEVRSGIDVHSTDPTLNRAYSHGNHPPCSPYDIPLRALIAADVDGLLMAGRCISGDFLAHSSYRMTGNAVPMGEAAGRAAALASARRCLPQELEWEEISAFGLPQATLSL